MEKSFSYSQFRTVTVKETVTVIYASSKKHFYYTDLGIGCKITVIVLRVSTGDYTPCMNN